MIALVLVLVGIMEGTALVWMHIYPTQDRLMSSGKIILRQFPTAIYQHITPTPVEYGSSVYHVTSAFGPAAENHLGRVVTGLVAAQHQSKEIHASVVMPLYSFLRKTYAMDRIVDLSFPLEDPVKNETSKIIFRVWRMYYNFQPHTIETRFEDGINKSIPILPTDVPRHQLVPIYLIGQAIDPPLSYAFRARNEWYAGDGHHYPKHAKLPAEWSRQFFAKASATFIAYRATARDDESLFAPLNRALPSVDIVHLHGTAVTGAGAQLRKWRDDESLGPKPPVLVFSLHHHDDTRAVAPANIVQRFMPFMHTPLHLRGVFLASHAIDAADTVTIANRPLAKDIVEGRHHLPLKELIMDHVLRKAQKNRWIGTENRIDPGLYGPFVDTRLIERRFHFPEYTWQQMQSLQQLENHNNNTLMWELSLQPNNLASTAKDRAKRYLVRRGIIHEDKLQRPLVLYDAHTIHNIEDLAILQNIVYHAEEQDIVLVVIVQTENSHAFKWIMKRQKKQNQSSTVFLLGERERQRFEIFVRVSADAVVLANYLEDTLEALLFGSAVIVPHGRVSAVQLVERPQNTTDLITFQVTKNKSALVTTRAIYNAYVYHDTSHMGEAMKQVTSDLNHRRKHRVLEEEFVLRMIRIALCRSWDNSMVSEYLSVYAHALKQRQFPDRTRHEVNDELTLVRRLEKNDPDR